MTEQPNYYAIIPATVRYSKELSGNEKLFYGELTCLTHRSGYCFATNSYFAELYGVSERCIRMWLDNLENGGFIRREHETVNNKTERKIYVIEQFVIKRGRKKTSWAPRKKTSG
jgi:hypothetical protein